MDPNFPRTPKNVHPLWSVIECFMPPSRFDRVRLDERGRSHPMVRGIIIRRISSGRSMALRTWTRTKLYILLANRLVSLKAAEFY